jgi:hypothetical protein
VGPFQSTLVISTYFNINRLEEFEFAFVFILFLFALALEVEAVGSEINGRFLTSK